MAIKKFFRENYILIAILVLGFLLRVYGAIESLDYAHDQDLAGWIIKDIVVNKHFRLIGQETSTQGIFIGPFYYYLLIPFYLLFNMDPVGVVVLATLLGLFNIWSFYFVFSRVHSKKVGLIAAFFYAVSYFTISIDRGVLPITPVIVWTVWFYYAINLVLKGNQKTSFLVLGILVGLIWNFHAALALLIPLIPLSLYLAKKKVDWKALKRGILALFITSLPLIIFELRHNFSQARALYNSFSINQGLSLGGLEKLQGVIQPTSQNITTLLFRPPQNFFWLVPLLLIAVFVFLVSKKIIFRSQAIIMALWPMIFVAFFTIYSKNIVEYYLYGMMVMWIAVLVVGIGYLLSRKNLRKWGVVLLILFGIVNFSRFLKMEKNLNGYIQRKALVSFIKEDALKQGYPCISVSHISFPGYDLGYRYLFWLENMHVNAPRSKSPVYTVVFPSSKVGRVDETFGSIGLVLPDYDRYSPEAVLESCSGENSNLTDSMFGYTE